MVKENDKSNDESSDAEEVERFINDPKNAKAVKMINHIAELKIRETVKRVAEEQPGVFDQIFKLFED